MNLGRRLTSAMPLIAVRKADLAALPRLLTSDITGTRRFPIIELVCYGSGQIS